LEVDRNELSNTLKSFGARVTGSVSKKTTYLLHGERLEDGRSADQSNKYKEATKLGVQKLTFEEMQNIMREKLNNPDFDLANPEVEVSAPIELNNISNNNITTAAGGNKSYLNKNKSNTVNTMTTGPSDTTNNITQNNGQDAPKTAETEVTNSLWTTKYAPKNVNEIVGNAAAIKKFISWLDDWDDVVINGNKKDLTESTRGKGRMENPNARACLISGDPGIGKTTAVRLIAKLKGYRTFELNASDQRNKNAINATVGYLRNSTTLNFGEIFEKNLIIMDEVDGAGGNEDRGGIQALIKIIKETKMPIVCIANDRQSQKIKSLANYCYDLKFNKPDKRHIVQRLLQLCKNENFNVEPNALEYLVECVGNDIRQCLNFLELWHRRYKELKYSDMTKTYNSFNKDSSVMVSNFDSCAKILNKPYVKYMIC
jgi:replication factor C subunit 1